MINEKKTYETSTPGLPGISVKVRLPKDTGMDHGKLAGFASINLGGVFAVNNIRIYNTERGPYVAMPSKQGPDGKYHDICCPTTKEMRLALNAAVLDEYQKEIQREQQERDYGLDKSKEEMEAPESQTVSEQIDRNLSGMETDREDNMPEPMDGHPEKMPESAREESPSYTRSGADERKRGEMDALREPSDRFAKKPSIREQLAKAVQQAQKSPALEQQQRQQQQQQQHQHQQEAR